MKERKEHYRNNLPHFQQPGQWYMVTWCLKDAVPEKLVIQYQRELEYLKYAIDNLKQNKADAIQLRNEKAAYKQMRKKYFKAFDEALALNINPKINLADPVHAQIMIDSLCYFEKKRLTNYAFCIMPTR